MQNISIVNGKIEACLGTQIIHHSSLRIGGKYLFKSISLSLSPGCIGN